MERIIKYIILATIILITSNIVANADTYTTQTYTYSPNMSTLVTPQNVAFVSCTKQYAISQEKLYYLTVAAVNANRFTVVELQSKTGYVLFKAVNRDFLATVVKLGVNKSMLKITPTNNNYYFAPGIVSNMFKYIDLNLNEVVTSVKKI